MRLLLVSIEPVGTRDLSYYWRQWMTHAADYGLVSLYTQREILVDYPPLVPAALWLLGSIERLIRNVTGQGHWWVLFAKLPAICGDVAVALLIHRVLAGGHHSGGVRFPRSHAFWVGAWFLNPTVVYLSAIWGQVDAILAAFLCLSLAAAVGHTWVRAGAWYGVALLSKFQAIVLGPLLFVWALRYGIGPAMRGTTMALATMTACLAPFVLAGASQAVEAYTGAVDRHAALTVNAPNVWALVSYLTDRFSGSIPGDREPAIGPLTYFDIGLLLYAAYSGWLLSSLLRRDRRRDAHMFSADLWFASGLAFLGFCMLLTQMHERYLFPALAFLVVPCVYQPALRIWYVLWTFTTFVSFVLVEPPYAGVIAAVESFVAVWKVQLLLAAANVALFAATSIVWWRRPIPVPPGPTPA